MHEHNDIQPIGNTNPGNYNLEPRKGAYRDLRPRGIKWVKAAGALAEGKTAAQAAEIVGVNTCAVNRWKRNPKFVALLQRYAERIERESVATGIAIKAARMRKLNRQADRIESLMAQRKEALGNVPGAIGGDTGLISHDQKSIGAGLNAEIVDVYEFDAALSREYRGVLEQAAKEMGGQFDEAASATGPGGNVNIQINFPVMSQEQLDAVNSAPTIDLPPMARRLLSRPSDGQQR